MTILPRAINSSSAIPIKITMAFLIELEQIILKFVCKFKDSREPKQSQKENKAGGITVPDSNYNTK